MGDKYFQQSGLHILAGKGRIQEISRIVSHLLRSSIYILIRAHLGLRMDLQSRNFKGTTIAELLMAKDLNKEVWALDRDCVKRYKVNLFPPDMQVELV